MIFISLKLETINLTLSVVCVWWGREPPDAMSLCYADTSLPDLQGRPSLRHAVRASAIQNSFFKTIGFNM